MTDRTPRRRLELVPAGGVSREVMTALAREVDRRLGTASRIASPLAVVPAWHDPESGVLRSGAVVDALLARADAEDAGPRERWTLVVVDEELAAPECGRVFGEAAVGGGCAVVGLARPDGASESDSTRWMERMTKGAVHELGHAAGLDHCADPTCVMYPSASIADTDRKGGDFCGRCRTAYAHATLDPARP